MFHLIKATLISSEALEVKGSSAEPGSNDLNKL